MILFLSAEPDNQGINVFSSGCEFIKGYFRFYGSSYLHHCIIKDPILDTVICSVSHFHVEKWC